MTLVPDSDLKSVISDVTIPFSTQYPDLRELIFLKVESVIGTF